MLCELRFLASQYQKTWSKRATEIIDQDLAFISLFFYFKSSDSSQLGNVELSACPSLLQHCPLVLTVVEIVHLASDH